MPAKTHGQYTTPTYASWENMHNRCRPNNKQHKNAINSYCGIAVCDRWKKYENFLADMGTRPPGTSIDRINGSLGYFKENCRWANRRVQSFNTKLRNDNRSGHRGICWDKSKRAWMVRVRRNFIGRYKSLDEAIAAHSKAFDIALRDLGVDVFTVAG